MNKGMVGIGSCCALTLLVSRGRALEEIAATASQCGRLFGVQRSGIQRKRIVGGNVTITEERGTKNGS